MSTAKLKTIIEEEGDVMQKVSKILDIMIKEMVLDKPNDKDICIYMIKWLINNGGYNGNLLSNEERIELSDLRNIFKNYIDIDQNEDNKEVEYQETFELDPEDIDETLTKEYIKDISNKRNFRNEISEDIYGLTFPEPEKPDLEYTKKAIEDINELKSRLKFNVYFNDFNIKEIEELIGYMTIKQFTKDSNLINYEDEIKDFYYIKSGKLDCYKKYENVEKLVACFTKGDYFNDVALTLDSVSSIKLKVIEDGECYCLNKEAYNIVKNASIKRKNEENEKIIKKIPMLKILEPNEINILAKNIQCGVYFENEVIYKEKEAGDLLYYIEEGECCGYKTNECGKAPEKVATYKSGDIIDEICLLKRIVRNQFLIASAPFVRVKSINRYIFHTILGPIEELLKRNQDLYDHYIPPQKTEEEHLDKSIEENKEEKEKKEEIKDDNKIEEEEKKEEFKEEIIEEKKDNEKDITTVKDAITSVNKIPEAIGP